MRIFGREPAAWIAAIGSVLTVLAGMNLPGLSAGQASAITAAVSALLIAWATRPVAPALLTAAVSALVALTAEYGTTLPDGVVAGLPAVTLALFALITRSQVSPTSAAGAPVVRRE